MELRNLLDDTNWKKLGACEIVCVDCYDSKTPTIKDVMRMNEVNSEIAASLKAGVKPKTEVELLKEQIELQKEQNAKISERLNELESMKPAVENEKEIRKALFAEAKELGLTPQKNILTDDLKALIEENK